MLKKGTFGLGEYFVQETRKDICVKGPLVAFAGIANNNLPMGKRALLKTYI